MHTIRRITTPYTVLAALAFSLASSEAITIAGVNFDSRSRITETTNNDTASGLNWTTNGVAAPGPLTAVPNQALGNGFGQFEANGLFQTADTQDSFVPDLNVHNEGSYFVNIPLSITEPGGIVLTGMSFTGIITNNGGAFQQVGREVDFRAEVFGPDDTLLGSDNINGLNAFQNTIEPFPTTNVDLDFGNVSLASGLTYNIRLYVGADGELVGNNAGFDDLDIRGNLVPEPGVSLLGAFAGLLLLVRRR